MDESSTKTLIAVLIIIVLIIIYVYYGRYNTVLLLRTQIDELNKLNESIKQDMNKGSLLSHEEIQTLKKQLADKTNELLTMQNTTQRDIDNLSNQLVIKERTINDMRLQLSGSKLNADFNTNHFKYTIELMNQSTASLLEAVVLYYALTLPQDKQKIIKAYADSLKIVFQRSDILFDKFISNFDNDSAEAARSMICNAMNEDIYNNLITDMAGDKEFYSCISAGKIGCSNSSGRTPAIMQWQNMIDQSMRTNNSELLTLYNTIILTIQTLQNNIRMMCESKLSTVDLLKKSLASLRSTYTMSKNYILMVMMENITNHDFTLYPIYLSTVYNQAGLQSNLQSNLQLSSGTIQSTGTCVDYNDSNGRPVRQCYTQDGKLDGPPLYLDMNCIDRYDPNIGRLRDCTDQNGNVTTTFLGN